MTFTGNASLFQLLLLFQLVSCLFTYGSISFQGKHSIFGTVQPMIRPFIWIAAATSAVTTFGFLTAHQFTLASVSSIVLLAQMYVVALYERKRKDKD